MTDEQAQAPVRIPVDFFFDYICPFCYVASSRLEQLAGRYPLELRFRFVEIHPDNPAKGRPLSELGYPEDQWQQMMQALNDMIEHDGLPFAERTFTTNSRRAILLALATMETFPSRFLRVHRDIFHAYFVEQKNIGDQAVLQEIADRHELGDLPDRAWSEQGFIQRFLADIELAQEVGLSGVPTLAVGGRTFPGAVSVETLEEALKQESERAAEDADND